MISKIRKWGNSQGLIRSKKLLSDLGLSINDRVNVEMIENRLVISKALDNEISLKDVFAEYNGRHMDREIDWGIAKGREIS